MNYFDEIAHAGTGREIVAMPATMREAARTVNRLIGFAQTEGLSPEDPLCRSLSRLRDELEINADNLSKRIAKGWKTP